MLTSSPAVARPCHPVARAAALQREPG